MEQREEEDDMKLKMYKYSIEITSDESRREAI
jgi:hypothetical protein